MEILQSIPFPQKQLMKSVNQQAIQNMVDPYAWRDMKYKSQNIDKLLEWAMQNLEKKVSEKYSNITNTVRHLKNLMVQFSKKADQLEKNLIASTRIEETKLQSTYYRDRIKECEESSQEIQAQIEQKSISLQAKQNEANALKKSLLRMKVENIKLNMKMEELEKDYWQMEEKENIRVDREKRKLKILDDRRMLVRSPFHKNELAQENARLEIELFNQIDQAKQMRGFIEDCFGLYREKLRKQQKKSNIYGLAGSMLFKLETKQDTLLPKIKKLGDEKLIVYDILKQKYRKHVMNQNKKNQKLNITQEDFMKLTPIQIIGILELKGGLKTIINRKCALPQPAKEPSA